MLHFPQQDVSYRKGIHAHMYIIQAFYYFVDFCDSVFVIRTALGQMIKEDELRKNDGLISHIGWNVSRSRQRERLN